jgi:hypothetical protein
MKSRVQGFRKAELFEEMVAKRLGKLGAGRREI